jgi:chromosome segregation ATPase
MENQQQGQPNPAGGKTQGNGPGISGQFGSVTDYEKEIAKQEVKIAQLTEELRNYKKGDKTDAQRIAELEETVSKLNTNLKEKELEAYLVTKISDVELRNKKIKRFAELNMSIEDLKDIYDDKVNTDPKVVTKKTASVQSPESKVKLQVASTSEEGEESQVNDIRNRNNRISSLLSKGRLQ